MSTLTEAAEAAGRNRPFRCIIIRHERPGPKVRQPCWWLFCNEGLGGSTATGTRWNRAACGSRQYAIETLEELGELPKPIHPGPPEICTACQGDPVASDGSICRECDGQVMVQYVPQE